MGKSPFCLDFKTLDFFVFLQSFGTPGKYQVDARRINMKAFKTGMLESYRGRCNMFNLGSNPDRWKRNNVYLMFFFFFGGGRQNG